MLIQVLLMSHWWAWHGGVAYNQRMLQEVHPLMIFMTALGLAGRRAPGVRAVLIGAALWGSFLNACRVAFWDQHLAWVEVYHPEIVWSFRDIEPLAYLRWHGSAGFLVGILGVLGKVLVGLVLPALVIRTIGRQRQAGPVADALAAWTVNRG